ncbi:MAG: glutamine-hydrolyzing GMP synthase [Thaumarchaeota archaeon]|nr:glutamine-hydrolyzing GMP synthase [Nitrososphaerota archaeon]
MNRENIVVLDFGGQYSHLITRRIRDLSVYAELLPYDTPSHEIELLNPSGIILTGGPSSVYDDNSPKPDSKIFDLNIPILGICYGLQIIVDAMGGSINRTNKREYGKATLSILSDQKLFYGIDSTTDVWMSHGDATKILPDNFKSIASTDNSPYAAICSNNLYGVQFHPEVTHTLDGTKILKNFIYEICGCKGLWTMDSFVESSINKIKSKVGNDSVLCALSGGVDSSTVALLLHKAIGDRLTCVFVDHGLLRKNEANHVLKIFDKLKIKIIFYNESDRFLNLLSDVTDPEIRRKLIGREFIKVFEEISNQNGSFKWLAQGTLYPDVIESASTSGPAATIKTHHNVGGLPENLDFQLIEPLRELYKDEVRHVAKLIDLPDDILKRHPFPGPGLAVRIIGKFNKEKLSICRHSSSIVEEELQKSGYYDKVWQAFAIVGDDKAVGVLGDNRKIGYIVTVRIVESNDAMTADWVRLPYDILDNISRRITNEVDNVSWVTYTISSKPPSTIEPQ